MPHSEHLSEDGILAASFSGLIPMQELQKIWVPFRNALLKILLLILFSDAEFQGNECEFLFC